MEWAAVLGLNVINTGDIPRTFGRDNSKVYIDITWATNGLTKRIHNWEVLQGEVFAYHNYIYFEIGQVTARHGREKGMHRILNKYKFAQML